MASLLVQQEPKVLSPKEHVLDLEARTKGFQGLPLEKDLPRKARGEEVQIELEELYARSERMYDGIIWSSRQVDTSWIKTQY